MNGTAKDGGGTVRQQQTSSSSLVSINENDDGTLKRIDESGSKPCTRPLPRVSKTNIKELKETLLF